MRASQNQTKLPLTSSDRLETKVKRLNASKMSDVDMKKPHKIWELSESQLKTNVNFRVYRLHLMDHRRRSEESVDHVVTRAHAQTLKCKFEQSELEERIIELQIAASNRSFPA